MNDSESTAWYRSPLTWIMAGLLAWGLYLAIGSFFNAPSRMAIWRAALILGCTLVFLAFWAVVLSVRKRRGDDRS